MDTLNGFHSAVLSGRDTPKAVDMVCGWLEQQRAARPPEQWQLLCREVREHPLASVLHTEPFTARGLKKPRGYAGDAVTMDMIYGMGGSPHPLRSEIRALHSAVMQRPAMRGARWRRQTIREHIDNLARQRPGVRIASLAAGHLREIEDSIAVRNGAVATYWALDQDEESLVTVSRAYGKYGVQSAPEHVRDVIARGGLKQAPLDMITSTGLYDYLPDRTAIRLTRALLGSLAPGGRLLVANVTPQFGDAGYFEAVMDWTLIHRDAHAMLALLGHPTPPELDDVRLFQDPDGGILFLSASRR
ncbi:hypothetical protein [Streptomyces sp. NBC_01092]|uniref:hypothetical protein n=1 Tax=Streptomyces sp. NBC_01092 TaxID=2903748 RepID=UPI00386F09AE|nr:hypothetical protein OG254_48970 [Streptomyces sp. NBC_01092]